MFLILLTYKKPLEVVDQYLAAHREYLDKCYQNNLLIVSGPQNPRTGGILLSHIKERKELDQLLAHDPFTINGITDYEVIEFDAVKFHPALADCLASS